MNVHQHHIEAAVAHRLDRVPAIGDHGHGVAGIFQESSVRLVMSDDLPALKQEIVAHAKPAPVE